MSVKDFNDMFIGYQEARLSDRWEQAYWTACAMSVHTKHSVNPKSLMEPFLPVKTATQLADEKEQFFKDFNKQRKEGAE